MTTTDPWINAKAQDGDVREVLRTAQIDRRSFREWANETMSNKSLTKTDVVQESQLNPTFAYQILAGQRHAKRDKLLQLAFGMHLDIEEASELLERGGANALNPTCERDLAIAYCLARGMDVRSCDETLLRTGIAPLRPDYPNVREW